MFYMFIKMSTGWHGKEISAIKTADVNAFVANGEIVVFADDIETFTDEFGIEKDDITW